MITPRENNPIQSWPGGLTSVHSWDRIRWLGRSLCSHPIIAYRVWLSSLFIKVVGHEGVWVVSGFEKVGREREKRITGEKNFFFPARACPGEEEAQCHSKRHCFVLLSLSLSVSLSLMWTVHEMMLFWTKHAVSFKRKKTPKCVNFRISHSFLICSIKSSIAILILRISSIMSLPKSDVSSKVGHFFSFGHWSRSDLCNLTLNWSINF